ncbi:helix-turn-helix domain-containing protein [Streptomyces nogalater]
MSDTTERRREFGACLSGLRRDSGRSQRQFAAVLCAVSGAQSITRNEVSRWERGKRIPDVWLPTFAQVLGVPLRELEQAAAYARGTLRPDCPGSRPPSQTCCPTGMHWSPWRPPAAVGSAPPPWRVWRPACTASGSRTTCCPAGPDRPRLP